MNRASPVEIRKALEVANAYAKAGICFVPMPILNDKHNNELVHQADKVLEDMIKMAEDE